MVAYLRFLARSVPVKGWLNTRYAATARGVFYHHAKTWPCSGRRNLHTDKVPDEPSVNRTTVQQPIPGPEVPRDSSNSDWRHPRFGFAAADFPHLVYIKLPRTATKDDVKALIARAGLQNAQIFMYYFLETGKPEDFCFVKTTDANAAIASLSRFTLLGSDLKPQKFNMWKAPPQVSNLLAGWLPSPSSDLSTRKIRPPRTEPPNLLATLMRDEWIRVSNIPLKPIEKDSSSKVAEAFYQQLHHLDVVGITYPRLHRTHGMCCKILFGTRSDAKTARVLLANSKFMGKPGKAKMYRGGPEIHKALWDYRQSLPGDVPEEEIQDLLDKRYKEMHLTPADVERWREYPTPESAVGLKES